MSSLSEVNYNPQTDDIRNPINILQQEKSKITTNPLVTGKIVTENDEKIEVVKLEPTKTEKIPPTFNDINRKLSVSIMGLIDDLFEKPNDIPWMKYLTMILEKDERYTYLAVLLIFTTLFIILLN